MAESRSGFAASGQARIYYEQAAAENNLDRVCELETQIWFDGRGRAPGDVAAAPRALLYEMNRLALEHASLELGQREHDLTPAAYHRLAEIKVPVMVLTGGLDIPYMASAADFMRDAMPQVYSVDFADAAHLPNMEHSQRFNACVERFLETL